LRNVDKYEPLYPLNQLPANFALALGREIIYLLATRSDARMEGSDWEEIFARCIGADWAPSNVGLDDIVYRQMAWGTKTIKNNSPFDVKHVRLVCGRNSPDYSFNIKNVHNILPNELGGKVLEIWNARLRQVREKFTTVRTVVLIKGDKLLDLSVYEEDTVFFSPDEYEWQWNERNNLEGYSKAGSIHKFTWQPHGSQFTVISDVPDKRLKIHLKEPPKVRQGDVLKSIEYDDS